MCNYNFFSVIYSYLEFLPSKQVFTANDDALRNSCKALIVEAFFDWKSSLSFSELDCQNS